MNIFNKRLISDDCIGATGMHASTSACVETIVNKELYKKYDYWYINIYTLIRNFIECMDGKTEDKVKFLKKGTFKRLTDELANDIDILLQQVGDKINVYLYRPDYKKIEKQIDNFKTISDFISIKYQLLKQQKVISKILEDKINIKIHDTNHLLPKSNNVLITTHIPMDLLNFTTKTNIALLESYTGSLKIKKEWYTKYHKISKKDMSIFPFMEELYWILGDNLHIKPQSITIREELYDLALKKHWTSTTGRNKVLNDIKHNLKDIYDHINIIKRIY